MPGGIDRTTTEEIIATAGVSRGALYHHFSSRDEIVAAVYESEAAQAVDRAAAAVPAGTAAVESLVHACLAWLDEVARPGVAKLLVVDGPAALGLTRCREIEERHSLGRLCASINAIDPRLRSDLPVEVTARLLNAVLAEAGLLLVDAPQLGKRRLRRDLRRAVRNTVAGLVETRRS